MNTQASVLTVLGGRGRRRTQGYTMIEVLVALTILTVGFLAVAKMQITGMMANRNAMDLTEGATWAQDRMEALLGLPFGNEELADTGETPHLDPNPPAGYTISWNVTDNKPITGAKEIVLTTQWTGRFGQRSVRLVGVKQNL